MAPNMSAGYPKQWSLLVFALFDQTTKEKKKKRLCVLFVCCHQNYGHA